MFWIFTKFPISTSLIGEYNASNTLLAAAAWSLLHETVPDVLDIRSFPGAPGRMEIYRSQRHGTVIVDFAHTPDAMENIFSTLKVLEDRGQIRGIFGAGGDRDRSKRALMGAAAARFCDQVILTSDNPRTEDPMQILQDIAQGMNDQQFQIIADRKQAIRTGIAEALDNDITLVLGKGGEEYIEIRGEKIPYSDSETVKEIIRELDAE